MTTATELEPETLALRTENVRKILHPDGGLTPLLNTIGPAGTPPKPRRTRSDAGKPRVTKAPEPFFITIPGVQFDMNVDCGIEAFERWLHDALCGNQSCQFIPDMIKQLIEEVRSLRASK